MFLTLHTVYKQYFSGGGLRLWGEGRGEESHVSTPSCMKHCLLKSNLVVEIIFLREYPRIYQGHNHLINLIMRGCSFPLRKRSIFN